MQAKAKIYLLSPLPAVLINSNGEFDHKFNFTIKEQQALDDIEVFIAAIYKSIFGKFIKDHEESRPGGPSHTLEPSHPTKHQTLNTEHQPAE